MHVKPALRIVPLILSFIGWTFCGCASPNTPVKTSANDDNSSLQAHTPNSEKESDVQAEVPPLPETTNLNSLNFQPRRAQKTSPCSTLATPEPVYTEPLTPAEMKQNLAVAKKIIEEFQALKTTMPEFQVELPPEVQDWFCQRVDCSQPPNYIGCGGWDSFNQFNECCPDEAQKCADVQVSYGCQVGENFGYSGLGINQPTPNTKDQKRRLEEKRKQQQIEAEKREKEREAKQKKREAQSRRFSRHFDDLVQRENIVNECSRRLESIATAVDTEVLELQFNYWSETQNDAIYSKKKDLYQQAYKLLHPIVKIGTDPHRGTAARQLGQLSFEWAVSHINFPTPPSILFDDVLRTVFKQSLNEKALPILRIAFQSYQVCAADLSPQYRKRQKHCEHRVELLQQTLGELLNPEFVINDCD
ncbi:MAG: hypothetical protein JXX14_05565 [Deltaproteobacteria bacterium]|nr:hypothetical protein [Deltaproteobacteria bacterium]